MVTTPDLRWLVDQAVTRLPAGPVLFVEADDLARAIKLSRKDIEVISHASTRAAWLPARLPTVGAVVLGWSPHKKLVRMQLAMLAEMLPVGTVLWIFGGARSGVASAPRLLAESWSGTHKVAYGGHAELWTATLATRAPALGLHAWEETQSIHLAGQDIVLVSLPGVFSHGEVDEGTRLLLEHLPLLPEKAKVHDFGCGCGIISAWLKLRQPSLTVSASDISALAHSATHATLKANGIKNVVVHVEAGLAPLPGPFDAIISNPPFHTGQQIDRRIAEELFTSAASKLRRGGQMIVVANSFLPYQAPMQSLIGPVTVLAETKAFKVLRAVKA